MSKPDLAPLATRLKTEEDPVALNQIMSQIMDLTVKTIYQLAWRLLHRDTVLAEDLTQHVYTTLYERRHTIREPRHLLSWLYRTTIYSARTFLPNPNEDSQPLDLIEELYADDKNADPLEAMTDSEKRVECERALRAALAHLNPRYRRCLELIYFEGYSLAQVAKAIGVKTESVWSYHSTALSTLSKNKTLYNLL